jgi:hypothetical protein
MNRFTLILVALFNLAAFAGDIITATVIVDSSSVTNLNGTNAASITIDSDTRIWTNSVTSVSTQMLASTNTNTVAFRLLQHLRSYPFTDVSTSATNLGVVLIGAEGAALSITISNSWATVTYRTNTVGTGIVYRAPRSIESATTRAIVDDDVITRVNNASTNTVTASAASMVNFVDTSETQTVAGDKNFTGTGNLYAGASGTLSGFLNLGTYLQFAHSALTAHSAVTNFVADFTGVAYRSITAAADVNFVHSTNRAAVRNVVVFLIANGANRNLTFNASWTNNFVTAIPTVLTNGTVGVLSLTCWGTSETNVIPAYAVLGAAGSGGSGTDDQTAAEVDFTPAGNIAATDVQAALEELDTEKEPALTDSASLSGTLSDETGSGLAVFGTSPTITTPTISGAIAFPDGVRQTFNPDGTASGLNVGAHTADPSAPSNGDIWYDSNNNLLRARVNGATISITGSAGGLASTDIDTSAELRGIVTDESGTGALIFADGNIGAATATTPAASDNDTSVATTAFVQGEKANPTLTSAIVTFNAAADGLTDDTYDGITLTGRNAGETVAQWELVRFNAGDSEFHLADADAAGEFPARGIAVAASTDGNAITVLVQGVVRNDGWAWGTVGGPIYLSDTAGGLTQTAPSTSGDCVQIVGWALSDDEAYLNFAGHYVEAP